MEKRLIPTAIVLRDLGFGNCENQSDINYITNKIYLAMRLGIPLDYEIEWQNLTQPYSDKLIADMSSIFAEGYDYITNAKLRTEYASVIKKINMLTTVCPYDISMKTWIGIMVCVFFYHSKGFKTEQAIVRNVQYANPHFKEKFIISANNVYNILTNSNK